MRNLRGSYIALLIVLILATSGCKEEAPPVSGPPPIAGNTGPIEPAPLPPEELSPITGEALVQAGSPVAVSIDNYPNARPQTGLNEADIIYEVLAEGGITRYVAIFHSRAPETVGPVRSSRPYLALLAKEWGAVFGHCGGDPGYARYLRDWGIVDGDEFGYSQLYRRDDSRSAPHNLYTSVPELRKIPSETLPAPAKRYEFTVWSDDPEAGLEIRYSKNYAVQYKYNGECYARYILEGSRDPSRHVDRETKEPVEASNVIVQFAHSEVVDSIGRLDIDVVGSGKAVFLLGGVYGEGSWERTAVGEPTYFYGPDGDMISVVPGQTWVQIVPEEAGVEKIPAQ